MKHEGLLEAITLLGRPYTEGRVNLAIEKIKHEQGYIEQLQAQLSAEIKSKEAILQQARIWAGEAKTQRRIVNEIGSALGGMADWQPIVKVVEQLKTDLSALQWIPVSEGLPENGTTVDVMISLGKRVAGYEWSEYWKIAFAPHDITHYRYIHLPKEASDEHV